MNAPDALPVPRIVALRDWPDLPRHDPLLAAFRQAAGDCPASTFAWNDMPATITWRLDGELARPTRHCMHCRVGEFAVRLACDTLAPLLGELPYDIGDMPPAFHAALLNDLLAKPRQALELLLGKKVEISTLTESYALREGECEIGFTLEIGRPAMRLDGVLAGSRTFVAACMTAPLAQSVQPAASAPSAAVPLRCDLLAGRMTLSVEEWRSLRPGDVLLAERVSGSAARPAYGLVVGGVRLAMWNALRFGEQMMVEDNAGAAPMPPDETPGDDSLSDAVTDGTVDIRIHGRSVGKGEMVAVGDRLGIRLLQLRVKDDGSAT